LEKNLVICDHHHLGVFIVSTKLLLSIGIVRPIHAIFITPKCDNEPCSHAVGGESMGFDWGGLRQPQLVKLLRPVAGPSRGT
jgi:hypothetical protein